VEHKVYEMIPKHDYAVLLNQLEAWGVGSPKAVCRIYGVKTVQRAVEYVKHTPNVRCQGAYFTYMVRQLKKEQNPPVQSTTSEEKPKEVEVIKEEINPSEKRTQCPQINSPMQANSFLWDFSQGKYAETAEIIEFVRKVKRKYNFG
jgi:hypothetical protein